MKTIVELLKLTDVTVHCGHTWLAWDDGWGDCDCAWTVTHWPDDGPCRLVLRTQDEAEAITAFVKAAGLEGE